MTFLPTFNGNNCQSLHANNTKVLFKLQYGFIHLILIANVKFKYNVKLKL